MCGISGYIGKSKNPKLTYELATNLFKHLETRGTDAAGMWGASGGDNPSVIYHKEPVKSSQFIHLPIWEKVRELNPNILLLHARATTPGGAHAKYNKNNHPFVSSDKRIGLIHNGFIAEAEFLKKKYEMKTECDSEVLLRMYESGLEDSPPEVEDTPEDVLERMTGIEQIWSVVQRGMMAVGIGEIVNDARILFLFRNDKRPLWVADLRKTLGQIFFFSSVDIWTRAIKDSQYYSTFVNQKLIEVPVKQIWFLDVSNTKDVDWIKFEVDVKDTSKEWSSADYKKIPEGKVSLNVITGLDVNEEIIRTGNYTPPAKTLNPPSNKIYRKPQCDDEDECQDYYAGSTQELEGKAYKVSQLAQNLSTHIQNRAMEGSLTPEQYDDTLDALSTCLSDLEATWLMVK